MPVLNKLSDLLDTKLASLESEVGVFLQQKSRILSLPPSFERTRLLSENASIKDRSTILIAAAQLLKTKLTDFDPFDFKNWSQVKPLTLNASDVAQSLVKLHSDMIAHKRSVDSASGSTPASSSSPTSPSSPSAPQGALSPLTHLLSAKAVGVVAVIYGLWKLSSRRK